jgi:hypothetical protein
MNVYHNASPPAPWAARVGQCLSERAAEWTSFPCTPWYHLSDYVVKKMYAKMRNIKEECLNELDKTVAGDRPPSGEL